MPSFIPAVHPPPFPPLPQEMAIDSHAVLYRPPHDPLSATVSHLLERSAIVEASAGVTAARTPPARVQAMRDLLFTLSDAVLSQGRAPTWPTRCWRCCRIRIGWAARSSQVGAAACLFGGLVVEGVDSGAAANGRLHAVDAVLAPVGVEVVREVDAAEAHRARSTRR